MNRMALLSSTTRISFLIFLGDYQGKKSYVHNRGLHSELEIVVLLEIRIPGSTENWTGRNYACSLWKDIDLKFVVVRTVEQGFS
jgi:hypothetical protein